MAAGRVTTVNDQTATYLSEAKDLVEKAVLAGAVVVTDAAKNLIKGPYPETSLPLEPPHLVTGALKKFIDFEGARSGWGEFIARVGPTAFTAKYGKYLELGTEHMIPRPYLRPALDAKMKEVQALIEDAIVKTSERKATGRDVMTGRFTSGSN